MALPPEERNLVEQPTDPHAPVVIVPTLPVVGRTLGEFVVKDKIGGGGFGDEDCSADNRTKHLA